jgi:CRP-like cAMP-binding protein
MHTPNLGRPFDNKLLVALQRAQFDLLAPHLMTVSLSRGQMLVGAGDEFDHVYFPQNGMLSLLAVLSDGKAIETATVGREGVVGAMAGFGLYKSLVRVIVQLPMAVSQISAVQFRKATANSDAIRMMCIQYNEGFCTAAEIARTHPNGVTTLADGGTWNLIAPPTRDADCYTQSQKL